MVKRKSTFCIHSENFATTYQAFDFERYLHTPELTLMFSLDDKHIPTLRQKVKSEKLL